jgi:L-galactose dehydrogenase
MEYTILGKTGLKVSKLGLGGAPLAGDFGSTDADEVQYMIHEAIDSGINFIDTAPLYGKGESERRIGQALKDRRDRVVLATKAVKSNLTYDYKSTIQSVEDSLLRLQTDYIDLLQLHDVESQSYDLVMNEAIPALQKLRQDGKIGNMGVTTRELPLLMKYMKTGCFDTIQFYARYMLIDHTAKDEVLPLAKEMNMGVINGSVLGLGLLAEVTAHFMRAEIVGKAQARMDQLQFLRKTESKGLIEPGMRFSLTNPDIHVSLTGVATRETLRMNIPFCDGKGLEPEELRKIYDLFQDQPLLD